MEQGTIGEHYKGMKIRIDNVEVLKTVNLKVTPDTNAYISCDRNDHPTLHGVRINFIVRRNPDDDCCKIVSRYYKGVAYVELINWHTATHKFLEEPFSLFSIRYKGMKRSIGFDGSVTSDGRFFGLNFQIVIL